MASFDIEDDLGSFFFFWLNCTALSFKMFDFFFFFKISVFF